MGEEELHARFLAASRAFLRDPGEATLETLLARFSLYFVAIHGSEAGLDPILARIEQNCRNIMAGLP
jgi:hypothetical protein